MEQVTKIDRKNQKYYWADVLKRLVIMTMARQMAIEMLLERNLKRKKITGWGLLCIS
jgi:hypothetical protein